jgi:methionyl-tRNA formyltransferase
MSPPAGEAAAELGLDVLKAESVNRDEELERIAAAGAEVAAVCAFGQLIREPLLSALPMLNVHPSLLPRWRGAAPIERAIMAGDARTGVSIMELTEGLDSGPVALQEEVEIGHREEFGELAGRLAELGGELLVKALGLQAEGRLELVEQDDGGATYAEKIEPGERRLDPARPAPELARRIRALTPHVGAYLATADGGRLGVRRARPLAAGPAAGELQAEDGELLLGCGEGALALETVQPPGGRPMPAGDFLRGHPLPGLA